MKSRKILGPVIGLLISGLFLTLALYRVDLNATGAALAAADYRLVALSALFTFSSYIFRTARWAKFLQPQKRIPLTRLFPVLVIGFALNNLLPGRPGEIARAFALGQREGLPKTAGLATVIIERVADGLTLIAVLAFISLGFELPGWGRQVEGISLGIFAVALAGLLFLLLRERLATRILDRLLHLVPARLGQRLAKMFASFILGLHSLRSPRDVLTIALLSLGAWLSEAAHYFFILTAFGRLNDFTTRALAASFTMVVVNLSISIPAAPGGVGPFEYAGVLALSAFSLARENALPAVLVAHGVQFILITALGIFFIAHAGLRLSQAVEQVEGERVADSG